MKITKDLVNTQNISSENGGQNTSMVFIQGNIPSSKNSKVATSRGVFHSKTVAKFLREMGIQHYSVSKKEVAYYKTKPCLFPVKELKELFKNVEYPCEVGLHFVRQTKSRFDLINIAQIVMDLMVAFKIIEDDDTSHVLPRNVWINGQSSSVSKTNPGVFILILNKDERKEISLHI